MKLTCNTIGDMLPLVVEDLASQDTIKLVKDHIKDCSKCRAEYEEINSSILDSAHRQELDTMPLKNVKIKLKNRNFYIGILTAFIISLILFVGFDKVTKPIALSYENVVQSIEKQDDLVYINFNEEVSDYDIVHYKNGESNEYEVMAWKTHLSSLLKKGKNKSVVVNTNGEKADRIYYISQGKKLDKLIYGSPENGGQLTLPRLAMNYYLLILGGIFVFFLILNILFQKKQKINKITLPIMLISVSYILGHIVIMGINGTTHHILRELIFVLIAAILFFIILILLVYKGNLIKVKN